MRLGRNVWRHASTWDETNTIGAEIFGVERSRQHARSLAESQTATDHPKPVYSIIARLDDNGSALLVAYRDICSAVADGKAITPAAEWLIDNYHLVEEQIRQTKADLPPGFYRQLPKLAEGPLAGHPRIFGLVWAYVAHNDSRFDPSTLTDFVNEYQQVQPLTIGELWAVAISLRLILIENLRRVAQRILQARRDREAADDLADLLFSDRKETRFGKILDKLGEPKVTQQFAVQLIHRLRDENGLSSDALEWLKTKTEALGYNLETAVNDEHHRQSSANVTVRNIVTSMRLISDVNWEIWFDTVSLVDGLLRSHENYVAMDFPSRTIYRTSIEELARGSRESEMEIAQRVLDLREVDPGYHLIGAGRVAFERAIGFKPPLLRRLRMGARSMGLSGYLGGAAVLTTLACFAGFLIVQGSDRLPLSILALMFVVLIPASDFALATLNYIITRLMDAAVIPGFALRDGVPQHLRTLVVMPALLTSRDDIEDLVDRLEIHFLSNADGEIHFALLTDWLDSTTETAAGDDVLLQTAQVGIDRLNQRNDTDKFLLLHRKRLWNAQEGKWMGWERKRGKLHELNRLLGGATDTNFVSFAGALPDAVKFVITLDADTKLPRDAARRLVGKLAHPLNRPIFDSALRRVTSGFGVLQPRVTPSLPVGHYGSLFQQVYSTSRGIDPYVFAVSDLYQDLFGEGSFAGKGIYDVSAFEQSLAARIPENTLLSHDLFEGIFARAALVTDIEVVEEFPERYAVSAARQHRWTRGDWQLLPWIVGFSSFCVPALGRWKMIDNLRRSLSPIASLACLVLGWAALPVGTALAWTLFILFLGFLPALLPAISGALPRRQPLTVASRVKSSLGDFGHVLAGLACNIAFLGHQAGLMADAIIRTLYRLTFSHRKMLEWTTAAQSESSHQQSVAGSYSTMAASVVAAIVTGALLAVRGDKMWMIATPFAILWLAAPALAHWMSQSPKLEDALASSPDDRKSLRLVARRTWRFFETFVTTQDNMLPPDNFQEQPKPLVAHRTSPTNIGLYLLSVASAREFGWLGFCETLDKIEATIATVTRLEKYRGHLYNWYDTTDLRPLDPKYISTVDSGNLAGHLIAVSNYCHRWIAEPAAPTLSLDGLTDILDILTEELEAVTADRRGLRPLRKQLGQQVATLKRSMEKVAAMPDTIAVRLIEFAVQANAIHATATLIAADGPSPQGEQLVQWATCLRDTIESHFKDATLVALAINKRLTHLATATRDLALAMEFGFLLEPRRLLLSIGYRVADSMRDESCYDMLASEARLASYFAIAKGDLRTRHWFRLGRTVTAVKGGAALMSWSGSMFEYLMPSLVMRAPSGGLLDQTTRLIVERQIAYASTLGIPWGISESAFNARDIEFTYQYSNFGVPGLGLKRGLSDNTVIAPYATGLATMIAPRSAAQNYKRLTDEGARGAFGFYEALDYTPSRLRKGETVAVVRAYFAHHQGMTIVAILNAVNSAVARDCFHAEPMVRATELLLQERSPRNVPLTHVRSEFAGSATITRKNAETSVRFFQSPGHDSPITHLLSNGRYNVMLTAAGSGYSTWNGQAITRWREDSVTDEWGAFFYLRDIRSQYVFSAGHLPVAAAADSFAASFTEDRAEFVRKDGNFTTTMECVVSPEDDAEARRITIANGALTAREIEITSFAELVLAPPASDTAHPAFSKLFVTTSYIAELEALVATRRKRSPSDPDIWVAQFMLIHGAVASPLEYETDRAQFIGIGNTVRNPAALRGDNKLSNTTGAVLDPAFALRRRIRIAAGRQVRCTLWTVVADSRQAVLDLVDRHRQPTAYERATMLAWTQGQIQLRHLSIDTETANQFQALASHVTYANSALRTPANVLAQTMGSQSALWPHGISGDKPIVLLRIDDIADIELVHQLLQAFEYWQSKGLFVDLVILNDRMSSYVQDLQNAIETLARKINVLPEAGRFYTLRADLMSPDTLRVLPAVARVVLLGRRGDLSSQLLRVRDTAEPVRPAPVKEPRSAVKPVNTKTLEFFNGFGGFGDRGREYVTVLSADKPPSAPWINVIANEGFGFHAAADGGGYTWAGNSRENQLTPWSNDPVSNRQGEVIYVRDVDSGVVMSPTLAPLRSHEGTHVARHGFGYSVFERDVHKVKMELTHTVPISGSIKLSRLRLTNTAAVARTFAVTIYVEWVLGASRPVTAPFITTDIDPETGAMMAHNPWKVQGGDQVAYVDLAGMQSGWTGDRREFIGTHGQLASPLAIFSDRPLSNKTGAGLDPCCAMQATVTLAAGETRDIVITLGSANNVAEAQASIKSYRNTQFDDVLSEVKAHWAATLGAAQVRTPDRSFDVIMNGWLQYQTLACRMWARSGFYQASGAYGFRDQLQDSMALLISRPEIARAHILRVVARQFVQGDLQHWWLPASGMGVRTRISDDAVWLAHCVGHYVKVTGDISILEETVPFIEGQMLMPGEHDAFFMPAQSEDSATVYEHCARALDLSLAQGEHGLPLMGTGDWNDGMNRVGEQGRGESVWLGWFLLATLADFTPLAEARHDANRVAHWAKRTTDLGQSLEQYGWDGKWYRRAFFDDGSALGSVQHDECRIDAIAQSWAVLSGGAKADRAVQAMDESWQQLVRTDDKLMALFTPPFDKSERDPGYIKAYPRGIRENGGQYTHGVIWSIFAHAKLGQTERAVKLFSLLNPINHALTETDATTYRIEPYVIAADIYSVEPHVGRGGWSWYTGSAAWMHRAGLEAILGVTREGNTLRIKPCVPADWNEFVVSLKFGDTAYEFTMSRNVVTDELPPNVESVAPGEYLVTLRDGQARRKIDLRLV